MQKFMSVTMRCFMADTKYTKCTHTQAGIPCLEITNLSIRWHIKNTKETIYKSKTVIIKLPISTKVSLDNCFPNNSLRSSARLLSPSVINTKETIWEFMQ